MKQLNYAWRLLATAISFSVFGIGGLLLWGVVFPFLSLLPGDLRQKNRRAQGCIHASFYFFIGLMHRLGIMTYRFDGLEKLNRPGQLILANHPTLVDIVFLLSRIKEGNCIVKQALWHNPFMRGPILNAGYISNGDPEKMIADCVTWLQSGGQLVIFPEGTRTVPGQAYRFQRGAAAIALQANTIVTPVTLHCTPSTLTKAEKWYQIPAKAFHLTAEVGDDLNLEPFLAESNKTLAVRHFNHSLQQYFSQRRADDDRSGK